MILADIFELWNSAWPAGLITLGLGVGFAVVLLIASIKLKVETDPKVEQVHNVLPHFDCGACGYAGCASYAKAVVEKPSLIGLCTPGGTQTAARIAEVLNLQISDSGPTKRPIVHCRAHTDDKTYYAKYEGIPTCTSANALVNVQACKFGCLGYGDCVAACKFDALHIVDGLATVDYTKCTGCGACSKACPRNLIEMVPFGHENMLTVACKNKENGKTTRAMCKVGCIACGLCAKQTPLFTIDENLAMLDYVKYQPSGQTETAMNKCPTGVIVLRGPTAPLPRQPDKKPAAATA
ncbi:MAG: RnfABCDGE type electron transport complex subunit B [Sedimentisphaerales bacterium]|nr:RnfABCDGE type electron transport complex subunit B [Sedimentisphaerales bacterium]